MGSYFLMGTASVYDDEKVLEPNGGCKEHRPHKTPLLTFFGGVGGDAVEA